MKKKFGVSLGSAILLAAICVGLVFAFSYTTTDGYWGQIDPTGGPGIDAECDGWGKVTNSNYTIGDVIGVIYNRNYGPGGQDERYERKTTVCAGDPDGDGTFGEWNRTPGDPTWSNLGTYTGGCTTATSMFISEYIWNERGSNPDELGIEIYNGTTASIDLSGWSLLLFTADNAYTEVELPVVDLAVGGKYVIANNAANNNHGISENLLIDNNDAYRTVVLIYNYSSPTLDGTDFDWADTVQDDVTTDENQVRYGRPVGYAAGDCPSADTAGDFLLQSGFGFEGIEDRAFEPAENQPFPIGRFCHYNNPIYTAGNKLDTVPLNMIVYNVTCPAGWTLDETSDDLAFQYQVNLNETTNGNIGDTTYDCVYDSASQQWPGGADTPYVTNDTGPNRNGCADGVNFTNVAGAQSFTCRFDTTHTQDFTVSILGFTSTQAGGVCPDIPATAISFNQIYTAETAKNCYCVYAAFTKGQITPVVLKTFSATSAENGILVAWETATEVNNLGFNIYRAELVDGERALVNPELIMSKLAPGDMFGATYEYLDEGAAIGVTYYYWLEDVPLESGVTPGIYGPISAVR